jgi:hypothetical protein
MGSLRISVVAHPGDLELLTLASHGVEGTTVTTPQPVDPSGEGLDFPIDGKTIMDTLEVAALFLTSADALSALFERWFDLRSKRPNDDAAVGHQIFLANVQTGEVLYEGSDLDTTTLHKIADNLRAD